MSKSYTEKLREKLLKDAEKALNKRGGNELEFAPEVGTYLIRVLPPVNDGEIFYYTHSYHWIPADANNLRNKEGKYLWTRKNYEVKSKDGSVKKMKDPIDEAVKDFYAVGRRDDDAELKNMGSILKRKRNYFCNIILYTEEGPEFRVLVDKTNEGKLMKIICKAMGIPFWRDIEDDWIEKDSAEIDPDRDYFDLLDLDNGHDFKIIKRKTGKENWDISYEDSIPTKKPRALTDEEKELLDQRVDLKNYIAYEEDYSKVKAALDNLIGESTAEADEEDEEDDLPIPPKKTAAPTPKAKPVVEEDDDDDEDDEEDEAPVKPAKKKIVKEEKNIDPDDDDEIKDLLDALE